MNVIARLKRKLIVTVVAILAVVFAVVLIALNLTVYRGGKMQSVRLMKDFAAYERQGRKISPPDRIETGRLTSRERNAAAEPPEPDMRTEIAAEPPEPAASPAESVSPPPEEPSRFWHFLSGTVLPGAGVTHSERNVFGVKLKENGTFSAIVSRFPLRYTESEIAALVSSITPSAAAPADGPVFGVQGAFRYLKEARPYGALVVFSDCSDEFAVRRRLLVASAGIYALAMFVSFAAAAFFADRAVRPVRDAFENQKRFIADAGHELKTPIAVIGANADALAGEIGENKWLGYIVSENIRMGELVKDLLYLAKSDAGREPFVHSEFDASRAVTAAVLPFESIVYEHGQKLELRIPDGIRYTGDERHIIQAVVVLIDNAVKNASPGALIRVSLRTESGRSRGKTGARCQPISVSVFNEGEGLDRAEMKKIFRRFYRSDASRTRETGGCGLGLPIAESIAEAHNGCITVDGKKGRWIEFTLRLK
ncbi:sensor histidine kinase [Treponema brennaborense]|uniref:histidine kinase n=1 Tax=Treponema brennaborense (strain DSM 12168 / CIP 105900 / DD5/3) TaxID=906968 RepID=F4LPP6_TREBD|nr:HAMP domain-containing sensor histidine kinase [Treponema brennaborense]AEE17042.1 integral membrane sensor signal transduction histidine kinase [Treponema brennaborense DSM 12168]